jgi:predicted nuclease of restriction endonuclease-like (RecB) superfamily
MRRFYNTYAKNKKLSQLVKEIGWGHNIVIFEKVQDEKIKQFYLKMTINNDWSRHILEEKIKNNEYQNYLNQQTNFEKTVNKSLLGKLACEVKDQYNFDFLELEKPLQERTLEQGLVDNIVKFLAEMGGDFCFVGRQFRVAINDKEFFIDLLFYHRGLECLVAVELKADEFLPAHAGQMQFYLTALNKEVKKPNENPSVGIIICKKRDKTIVEYALESTTHPVGVATFKHKELPKKISKYLPSEEEIKKRLVG